MARWATPVLVLVLATLLAPLSAGAPPATPDERLVAELERATGASRLALRSLARPTPERATRATTALAQAQAALAAARRAAPNAVGALASRHVRNALQQGGALVRLATADVAGARYPAARTKLQRAITLQAAALRDFGQPLTKDFPAFAVSRNFRNIPAYRDYSGVTATAGEEVVEIIIGMANRKTAKAGEPDAGQATSPGLPISMLSAYQIQDPIGEYTTNHCTLDAGLITCPLRPTLKPRHSFTLAFGPKLERGTILLAKFRTASGRRSYSVFEIR